MYNLAPRFEKFLKGGTPSNLAPNSYIICDRKPALKNYAPFLSLTARKVELGRKIYTHAIYSPEDTLSRKLKGGSSLQNKSKRLVYAKDDIPSPTAYNPKKPEKGCKYKPPSVHGNGRLYMCRVPFSVVKSAPSVPTKLDENGYSVDDYGNIVKNLPDFTDKTIGPAYYDVPRGEYCFTTRKYHQGCQWAKSKTKRKTLNISSTPGPGTYDPKDNPCKVHEREENYRSMARYFSFAPRYTEGEMLRVAHEDMPGPGYYNLDTSSFRFRKSLSINPIPFVGGADRTGPVMKSETPGPGAYEICDCPTAKKQFSTKDVPFGFQSSRFSTKKQQEFPEPATYNIKGPLEEKISNKINKYSTVAAPFCQTAERKIGFISNEAYSLPGPGDYDVETQEVEREAVHASFFKSQTKRFRSIRSEDAGPARYNVSEPFNKNRNRTSHNTGKVPFQSSQSRTPGRETHTPGPADYLIQGKIGARGSSFSTTDRFNERHEDIPGPGSYTLHLSVGRSIYKAIGTNNLRLKENVMRTKLRRPPRDTYQNWATEIKKKKKLRWFEKPSIDYRHCTVVT